MKRILSLFACMISVAAFASETVSSEFYSNQPLAVAQCLEAEFKGGTFPETQEEIGMGVDFYCVSTAYQSGGGVSIEPESTAQARFRFKKTLFGFNDELLGYEPIWEYAIAEGPDHHEAWLSILKGIKNGFMRRALRVNAKSELILEDSYFESDALSLGLGHAPKSALDPDNRAIRFSVCRQRPASWSEPYKTECLKNSSLN